MPHSVSTYRKRAEAQFIEAVDAPDDLSRANHLELAQIFHARADLISALAVPPSVSDVTQAPPR